MTADVTLVGTMGGSPDLRYTQGGRAAVNFSLAVNRRWQKDGEWQETTSWFRVQCWAELAENVVGPFAGDASRNAFAPAQHDFELLPCG